MSYKRIFDHIQNQEFSNQKKSISYDRLICQYSSLENEAVYIVDYKNLEIEPLSKNFDRIIGMPGKKKIDPSDLYEHVHSSDLNDLTSFVKRVIESVYIEGLNYTAEKDLAKCVYKSADNRIILKTTFKINSEEDNGLMRYSIGKLTDITGLVPYNGVRWRFEGPGRDKLEASLNDFLEFQPILTRRELQILTLISKGYSSRQISEKLFISKLTVDTHRKNIIKKLEASNAIDAYKKAIDAGLMN